jgi:hypothetical protein
MSSPLAPLYALQTDPRRRLLATVLAAGVGLVLGAVHWIGLVAGGALVGLCWPRLRDALLAGFGFGVVVVIVFVARLALAGTLAGALGMGPLVGIAVVTPLLAGPLGAVVRGIVPPAR